MKKRSLTLAGHRTSVAMEPEFWAAVDDIAKAKGLSVNQFIEQIDEQRDNNNLSSAVRLTVLAWFRDQHQS